MSDTANVKYVFLDIVAYTQDRSVEAQSDLVAKLNEVVEQAIERVGLARDKLIFLPTGDGIAIALVETGQFDSHLTLALQILRLIADHNHITEDKMRRFEVRIGINQNVDNVVTDINGKQNVAGDGIAMAQRIMNLADQSNIMVGRSVFEILSPREKYMRSFRKYDATVKHGVQFPVYQFLDTDNDALNSEEPIAFLRRAVQKPRFTELVAYYVGYVASQRSFLLSLKSDPLRDPAGVTLCYFLARDAVQINSTPPFEEPYLRTWGAPSASFEEQYAYYSKMDQLVLLALKALVEQAYLSAYAGYFERDGLEKYLFVRDTALDKLRAEWPAIAKQFSI